MSNERNITIEIETTRLSNNTIFEVTDECTKQGVDTKDVETILIWVGNILHRMEFSWMHGKIENIHKKW